MKHTQKLLLAGCLIVFASGIGLAADEEKLSVRAEVDKAFVTIGERVEYRITVTHDPSIQIQSKIVPPPSDAFEIKEVHDFSERQGKLIVEGRRFTVSLYDLGEFILEPVTVRYRIGTGEDKSVQTNRLFLTVQSIDTSGKPKVDIKDVKGVLGLRRDWRWLIALVVILGIGGVGGYIWWAKRRRVLGEGSAEELPLSPEDEALIRLNRLFDSDLIRRGEIKQYFLELSEILRRYLERRFEILAVESTTSEILRDLREKEVSRTILDKIQEVMEVADLVKFAKRKPTPSEIVKVNQLSKAAVEEARPKIAVSEAALTENSDGV